MKRMSIGSRDTSRTQTVETGDGHTGLHRSSGATAHGLHWGRILGLGRAEREERKKHDGDINGPIE